MSLNGMVNTTHQTQEPLDGHTFNEDWPCRLSGVGSNLSITLPALSATLIDAYDNYTAARPCMTSLLTRLQDINSTVVVLPSDINVGPLLIQYSVVVPLQAQPLKVWIL